MVRAYTPQRLIGSIVANSLSIPQGIGSASQPVQGDSMAYEDLDIMEYETDNWFNAQFLQRIPLTINSGQVPSTQTNFPLLINDTYPDLIGQVEAELRFAGIDEIQLEYEIEEFDNLTGKLIAWVKKPTVSDGDFVAIYFDNRSSRSSYDRRYYGV